VITVQVNVSNHDLGGTKGSALNPGYEISSRNNEKTKLENDVILLSISKAVKRKRLKTKSENVIKLLRRMIYWPTVTDLDLSSTAITQNLVNQISNFTNFTRSYNIFKTIISLSEMLSLTIYLTLLKQNVESNPGMKNNSQALFKILTYNCNGLGDRKKLKRLILKLTPIVDKGGIVFLQETHLTDTNYLKTIWKNKFETNCIKTNSAGVITLFRNDYEVVETLKDSDGRQLVIAVKNNETELILANSYFPNEHKIGINFAESVYLKILEMQHKFPKYRTIAAGDYNACMNLNDSLNRQRTNVEKLKRKLKNLSLRSTTTKKEESAMMTS
jgi:exonuclease III